MLKPSGMKMLDVLRYGDMDLRYGERKKTWDMREGEREMLIYLNTRRNKEDGYEIILIGSYQGAWEDECWKS